MSSLLLLLSTLLFILTGNVWAKTVSDAEKNLVVNEQQAIGLFYKRNLDILAAHFNIDSAKAQEIIAAALPNPVFSFSFSELNPAMFNNENSNQPLPAISPQLQLLIETAGKRQLRIKSSELATEAVTYDLKDTLRTLTNAVRHNYYNLLLAQKTEQMARDNFNRYQEILRINNIRLNTGDISEVDYTRIEVETIKAEADLNQAQANLQQARAALLLLLGWPENSMTISALEEWPQANPKITAIDQGQLIDLALKHRPDLEAARIRIEQAEKQLTLAHRQVIPDVTVNTYYQRDPGNFFSNSAGVGFSVPIPLFYKQEGEVANARVGVNSAQLTVKQIEQSVRGDVMKALATWKSSDAIAQRFETLVIDRIEYLREQQEFAYQHGAISLLELIDAERSYKAMLQDYYAALANRSNAWADLLMAYGDEIKP